jgi:ABC-type transport system involved in multi-copper enzyme maturation permease subunit
MSLPSAWATWLRQTISWSNSRQSWAERLGGLALASGAAGLLWLGRGLSALQQVILWSILLVAGAILLRRGWLKLLGPVLFYDMVCSARRGRYILLRCVYAGILVLLLFSVFLSTYTDRLVTPQDVSRRAESYFEMLLFTQLAAVLLLTPVYVAGAIAEEKERRTLEFLLATDLRNREIVLSKLVARVANLTLLVMTGLPFVSLLQLLGGVDPNLVLAGFAATGLTMLGLGGISILHSTYLRRPRDAIALTYLAVVAYFVASFLSMSLLIRTPRPAILDWPVWFGTSALTVANIIEVFNTGNLWLMAVEVQRAGFAGNLADTLPPLVGRYALFQGVVAGVCTSWAVLRLRAIALKQVQGPARRTRALFQFFRRPRVGTRPMLWKEIVVEGSTRLGWLGRLGIGGLVIGTFVPAALVLNDYFFELRYGTWGTNPWGDYFWEGLARSMNTWVRTIGTLVACLTLLAVAVRASTCVSRERDRQTLDTLLSTPLDSDQILLAKCVGSVLAVRHLWLWLAAIWGLGVLTGGLHLLALPLVVAAWLIFAAFLAVLGAWFSIVTRTSLRATTWTLLAAGTLGVGHWLIWACCGPLLMLGRGAAGSERGLEYLLKFQAGLTPPASLAFLQFSGYDFGDSYGLGREVLEVVACCLFGLFVWIIGTALLWGAVSNRFRAVTNRLAVTRHRASFRVGLGDRKR